MTEILVIGVGILGAIVAVFAFRHRISKSDADLSVRLDNAKIELLEIEEELILLSERVAEKYSSEYLRELEDKLDENEFQLLQSDLETAREVSYVNKQKLMEKIVLKSDEEFLKTGQQVLDEATLAKSRRPMVKIKQNLEQLLESRPVHGAMRRFLD